MSYRQKTSCSWNSRNLLTWSLAKNMTQLLQWLQICILKRKTFISETFHSHLILAERKGRDGNCGDQLLLIIFHSSNRTLPRKGLLLVSTLSRLNLWQWIQAFVTCFFIGLLAFFVIDFNEHLQSVCNKARKIFVNRRIFWLVN